MLPMAMAKSSDGVVICYVLPFLADHTIGRAYGTVCRLSVVCLRSSLRVGREPQDENFGCASSRFLLFTHVHSTVLKHNTCVAYPQDSVFEDMNWKDRE